MGPRGEVGKGLGSIKRRNAERAMRDWERREREREQAVLNANRARIMQVALATIPVQRDDR